MVQLRYIETDDFIVFEKPIGLNSHAVDPGKEGLVEFLSEKLSQKLHIISRLDQPTSGLILIAKDPSVQKINTLWEKPETQKVYLLLTDKKYCEAIAKCPHFISHFPDSTLNSPHFMINTEIKKEGKGFLSLPSSLPNSATEFLFLKSIGNKFLWQATLHTGKTHQIRLHCQNLKMPILGDTLYGGSAFYRVCLHSWKITINQQSFVSSLPVFADSELPSFPTSQIILEAIHKRQENYTLDNSDCFRWLHQEVPGLKLDQFGKYLYLYDYENHTSTNLAIPKLLVDKLQLPLFVRKMQNRGSNPNENSLFLYEPKSHTLTPTSEMLRWQAMENEICFELRTHQGLSPGLFLDQRENRQWVKNNSHNKTVLNLFSYTSGFSLAAAIGGAKTVDTVDVSKNFIEWSQQNFEINKIDLQAKENVEKKFRFWVQDCLLFLKIAKKKNKKWDMIICDPPTFGRSKNGIFQIENNFEEIINDIFSLLENKGVILLSLNYEKWSQVEIERRVKISLQGCKFELKRSPYQSLEFDYPHQTPLMKSLLICKG